jgi:hypothetical protein
LELIAQIRERVMIKGFSMVFRLKEACKVIDVNDAVDLLYGETTVSDFVGVDDGGLFKLESADYKVLERLARVPTWCGSGLDLAPESYEARPAQGADLPFVLCGCWHLRVSSECPVEDGSLEGFQLGGLVFVKGAGGENLLIRIWFLAAPAVLPLRG